MKSKKGCDYIFAHGWMPLPLTSAGKPGASWKGVMDERDVMAYKRWRSQGWRSWGVITGPDVIVLDCDTEAAVKRAEKKGIPDTFQVKTRRGMHWYFKGGGGVPTFKLWKDADLKGMRGMVKLFDGEKEIVRDIPVASAPRWLVREIEKHQKKKDRRERKILKGVERTVSRGAGHSVMRRMIRGLLRAGEGSRNIRLNQVAWELGLIVEKGGLEREEVVERLTEAGMELGLSEREVERTIDSAI